jgi:hypothetical protein
VMETILDSAWDRLELESAWRILKEDQSMQNIILSRIRISEESKANAKILEVEQLWKRVTYLRGDIEMEEHTVLDKYLVDRLDEKDEGYTGHNPNWESDEFETLDKVLEMTRPDSTACLEDNTYTSMMKTYLNNTDLASKRMVGATEVDPHSPESELGSWKRIKYEDNYVKDKDILSEISQKDICVSTVSTEDNKTYSVSAEDIFDTLQEYKAADGGRYKRRLGDEGRWWLPPSWTGARRPCWPSSRSTSEGRRGGWEKHTDPGSGEELLRKHYEHKLFWKTLELTDNSMGEGDSQEHLDGDTASGGGHHGDALQDDHVPRVDQLQLDTHYGGAGPEHTQHSDGDQTVHGAETVDDQPGAPVHQHHGGGHSRQVRDQQPIIVRKRKTRMKVGVRRDGKLQLSMVNFTFKSGEGGNISENRK